MWPCGEEQDMLFYRALNTQHINVWVMAQWLEAELEGVDRCVTPWLLVGMHRPMYVPYPHKSNRVVGRHLQARIGSFCHPSLSALPCCASSLPARLTLCGCCM